MNSLMKMTALVLVISGLSGCSALGGMFAPKSRIKVDEVGRAAFCSSRTPNAAVQMLGSPADAVIWQHHNQVNLTGTRALPDGFYVAVEMGYRESGGYGFVVSPQADVSGSAVRLTATFIEPAKSAEKAGGPSSPCVLLRLPNGGWTAVDLRDQLGKRRARTTRP